MKKAALQRWPRSAFSRQNHHAITQTFLAHWAVSNLAPDFMNRLNLLNDSSPSVSITHQNRFYQMVNGSSHAVLRSDQTLLQSVQADNGETHMLSANFGLRSSFSSSSDRVHVRAAINPPAEVPAITRGSKSASSNALTTSPRPDEKRGQHSLCTRLTSDVVYGVVRFLGMHSQRDCPTYNIQMRRHPTSKRQKNPGFCWHS